MKHGLSGYDAHGCRCDRCKAAKASYRRRQQSGLRSEAREWEADLASLLHELAPNGLTDDCPARQGTR